MENHIFLQVNHGKPWKIMENHFFFNIQVNHGIMENHHFFTGKSWNIMENHMFLQVNHGKPWKIMENHIFFIYR